MDHWICQTCGTQFPASVTPPSACPICTDERQYVGRGGQSWTTQGRLAASGHRNAFTRYEPDLYGIGTTPGFAIGQRALLIRTPEGNILWDCISFLDEATVDIVHSLGGIRAIAISHPHFYSSMVDFASAFDATVLLHEGDSQWVVRPDPRVQFWSGDSLPLASGVTLHRLGGHFTGGTVLHWKDGASGEGALLTGDILQVVADKQWVSYMYSYPNLIPLPAVKVAEIRDAVSRLRFTRIYGGWWDAVVKEDAREAAIQSANRYIAALSSQ